MWPLTARWPWPARRPVGAQGLIGHRTEATVRPYRWPQPPPPPLPDEPVPLMLPDPCRLDVDVLSPGVCDYCGRPLHQHRAA
jgi:hypothetical protein